MASKGKGINRGKSSFLNIEKDFLWNKDYLSKLVKSLEKLDIKDYDANLAYELSYAHSYLSNLISGYSISESSSDIFNDIVAINTLLELTLDLLPTSILDNKLVSHSTLAKLNPRVLSDIPEEKFFKKVRVSSISTLKLVLYCGLDNLIKLICMVFPLIFCLLVTFALSSSVESITDDIMRAAITVAKLVMFGITLVYGGFFGVSIIYMIKLSLESEPDIEISKLRPIKRLVHKIRISAIKLLYGSLIDTDMDTDDVNSDIYNNINSDNLFLYVGTSRLSRVERSLSLLDLMLNDSYVKDSIVKESPDYELRLNNIKLELEEVKSNLSSFSKHVSMRHYFSNLVKIESLYMKYLELTSNKTITLEEVDCEFE